MKVLFWEEGGIATSVLVPVVHLVSVLSLRLGAVPQAEPPRGLCRDSARSDIPLLEGPAGRDLTPVMGHYPRGPKGLSL